MSAHCPWSRHLSRHPLFELIAVPHGLLAPPKKNFQIGSCGNLPDTGEVQTVVRDKEPIEGRRPEVQNALQCNTGAPNGAL
jgi:hypothetical protein